MRRNISLAIFATVSALTVVGSISPAPAAETIQDSYWPQVGLSGQLPVLKLSTVYGHSGRDRCLLRDQSHEGVCAAAARRPISAAGTVLSPPGSGAIMNRQR